MSDQEDQDRPDPIVVMPRRVVVALAGDDPKMQDLLAAWDVEHEARHAAEDEVTRLTQENKDQHDEIQQLHLAWLEQDRKRTELAQEHERLKAALDKIAVGLIGPNEVALCSCEHGDETCCALVDHYCPMCIAAQALKPIAAPIEGGTMTDQKDQDRLTEPQRISLTEPDRYSTREIVADRITVLEQYGAHPIVSDGPRRLGHNPSWVKAIDYDRLHAEVTRLTQENEQTAQDTISHVAAHWFTQGGKAWFGQLLYDGREPLNADEIISGILELVRPVAQENDRLKAELPFVLAQLRHAYMLLIGGHLGDPREFADGLISPQIARLEKCAAAQSQ